MAEMDQDDELNQSMEQSSANTRCNQLCTYMLEECLVPEQTKVSLSIN